MDKKIVKNNEQNVVKLKADKRLNKPKKEGGELTARLTRENRQGKCNVPVQINMRKGHLDRGDTERKIPEKKDIHKTNQTKAKEPLVEKKETQKPKGNTNDIKTHDTRENVRRELPEKRKLLKAMKEGVKNQKEVKKIEVTIEKKPDKLSPAERSTLILNAAIRKLMNEDSKPNNNALVDLNEQRRRLHDKYTFRQSRVNLLFDTPRHRKNDDEKRVELKEKLEFWEKNLPQLPKKQPSTASETTSKRDKIQDSSVDSGISDMEKKDESFRKPIIKIKPIKETDKPERKPLIKTVTLDNNSKTYKAVTFVEQKKKSTQLQISIPNDPLRRFKRSKPHSSKVRIKELLSKTSVKEKLEKPVSAPKTRSKLTASKTSVKEKPVLNRKKFKKNDRLSSPDLSVVDSPPLTEVAKWAPSSVDHHTQPYYEAWVDTTLTTRTKVKEKLHQEILRSLQKTILERPATPELVYADMNDERYTGRIKVRQR